MANLDLLHFYIPFNVNLSISTQLNTNLLWFSFRVYQTKSSARGELSFLCVIVRLLLPEHHQLFCIYFHLFMFILIDHRPLVYSLLLSANIFPVTKLSFSCIMNVRFSSISVLFYKILDPQIKFILVTLYSVTLCVWARTSAQACMQANVTQLFLVLDGSAGLFQAVASE